jgi:hypothetical protein
LTGKSRLQFSKGRSSGFSRTLIATARDVSVDARLAAGTAWREPRVPMSLPG